jgi:hypothetical protein
MLEHLFLIGRIKPVAHNGNRVQDNSTISINFLAALSILSESMKRQDGNGSQQSGRGDNAMANHGSSSGRKKVALSRCENVISHFGIVLGKEDRKRCRSDEGDPAVMTYCQNNISGMDFICCASKTEIGSPPIAAML